MDLERKFNIYYDNQRWVDNAGDPMNKEENDTITFDPGLIGREDELDVLKDCFDDSLEGRGATVFISGEAGIGKTKLVGELLKSVEEEGGVLFQGKCLSSDIEPLLPIKDALRDSQLHHIITKNPPPRVLSAYLMIQGGLVVTKAERGEDRCRHIRRYAPGCRELHQGLAFPYGRGRYRRPQQHLLWKVQYCSSNDG